MDVVLLVFNHLISYLYSKIVNPCVSFEFSMVVVCLMKMPYTFCVVLK